MGIGTIRSKDQIDLAIEAGASFAITPGFSYTLSEYALESGLTLIPGVQTASEVMAASEAGHKTLKFFPAELSGGVDRLSAFKSVFSDITFIPTGGITNKNITNYLTMPKAAKRWGWLPNFALSTKKASYAGTTLPTSDA